MRALLTLALLAAGGSAGSMRMEVDLLRADPQVLSSQGGSVVMLEGQVLRGQPGEPLLPAVPLIYAIPSHAENLAAEFTATALDTVDLPAAPVLSRVLYPLGWQGQRLRVPALRQSGSGFRPSRRVLSVRSGGMAGYRLATVLISPAALLPGGAMELAVSGTLTLSWENGRVPPQAPPARRETFGPIVRGIVENPEDVGIYGPPERPSLSGDAEYLLIADEDYFDQLQPLLDMQSAAGYSTEALTVQDAVSQFPGSDQAESVRNAIRHYWQNSGTVFVLLAGDETLVPDRLVYTRCENVPPEFAPSDLYFSDLDGSWDGNGDGVYGQFDDGMDLFDDVLLGRALFSDQQTAQIFMERTMAYRTAPPSGDWSHRAVLCGAVLFEDIGYTGAKGADSVAAALPADWDVTKAYQPLGGDGIDTHIPIINSGTAWNYYAGHGNDRGIYWSREPMTMMTSWLADTLVNGNRAGIHTSIACHPGDFRDGRCCAERLLQSPEGGAVSVTFNTSYGWEGFWPALGASEKLCIDFTRQVFRNKASSIGAAVTSARALRVAEMHGGYDRTLQSLLAWNAFHDPALKVMEVPPQGALPPYSLSVSPPWPNPSRRDAPVSFSVGFDGRIPGTVSVSVHDITGRLVWQTELSSPANVVWEVRNSSGRLPRGVYLICARRGALAVSRKVTVLE